jgi:regulator of protease activity HflC (stomatin/prohibitin superfamily)
MQRRAFRVSGFFMLLVLIALAAGTTWYVIMQVSGDELPLETVWVMSAASLLFVLGLSGFAVVNPNEAWVVQFLGRYIGSLSRSGFYWTVPLTARKRVSLRVRNFETSRLKVSDVDGNPVEIAAVVVWRVVDSFRAVFAVDDHVEYVSIQAEAAVRHLATSHPYEAHDDVRISLREGVQISDELTAELRERVQLAGVEIVESRITQQRQQASAVVAARTRIVDGAVGMVQMALERLRSEGVVELDEERKAQMVSNLLVVLCGDRATQPVVNTGTLYG